MSSRAKTAEKNPLPVWFVLFKRELAAYFSSPIAYIVIALFLITSGFLFFSTFFLISRAELRGFFGLLPILFAFFIPAVTMRSFAEEKRSGTIETLFTMPVSGGDVVAGKFFAALAFSAVMLVPSLAYVVTAAALGDLDAGPVIGGYLGALFLAAGFSAVGIYASSVTRNQIVAFFIAFFICGFLALVDKFLILLPSGLVDQLQYLSVGYHFESVARGIVDTRDIVYFLSLTGLFLWGTAANVNERREA